MASQIGIFVFSIFVGTIVTQNETTQYENDEVKPKAEPILRLQMSLDGRVQNVQFSEEKIIQEIDKALQTCFRVIDEKFETNRMAMEDTKKDILSAINNANCCKMANISGGNNDSANTSDMLSPILETTNQELDEILGKLDDTETTISNPDGNESYQHKTNYHESCKTIQKEGNFTGVHYIQPTQSSQPFEVYCDMETLGGGWAYFLNRFEGRYQNFFYNWSRYTNGFGDLKKDHWLGLEKLHHMAGHVAPVELLVELVDWRDNKVHALYDNFQIGDNSEGFVIKSLGQYSGNAGDSLRYHLDMKFSTEDQDQDLSDVNCAKQFHGGWWYNNCMNCHLTGIYVVPYDTSDRSALPVRTIDELINRLEKPATARNLLPNQNSTMYWGDFHGPNYSLKEARMMVRVRDNTDEPEMIQPPERGQYQ